MSVDPSDGLIVSEAGEWSAEKHERLRKYVDITRAARRKYTDATRPIQFRGGAAYIDLFCGPARCRMRGTNEIIDGSPLVAAKVALAGGVPFTEIHLADINPDYSGVAAARVAALGGNAFHYSGPADQMSEAIVSRLNPHGLHFAFVDPYNLAGLTFETMKQLARVQRMDLLLHLSVSDLQRNLDRYSAAANSPLDAVAPGWRNVVDLRQTPNATRAAYVNYWSSKMLELGFSHRGVELVTGGQNQRLYWLVFLSRSELANDLWDKIRHISGQKSFDL